MMRMRARSDRPEPVASPKPRGQVSLFARNFFQHPRMLGSIIPSSRFLVRRLLGQVDWERARVVVEYGPGVGTITRELLRRMHPDATLVVIETNRDFVEFLEEALPDPRLRVIHGSAESAKAELERLGLPAADYVLAGIPFSTMPADTRERILRGSVDALSPEGAMLIYQFTSSLISDLREVFSDVERDFELFNLLPARLYYCRP